MKIDAIELRVVRVRLREPFETSFGVSETEEKLLVRMFGEGIEGWGEAPAGAFPGYCYETAWTALWIAEQFLAPAVVGQSFESPEKLRERFRGVRGHPMAKAGIEFAFWDLTGRAEKKPVSKLLGGVRERVGVGISLGLQKTDDGIVEKVKEAIARGYRRVKLKIKPGRDVEMVRHVRAKVPEFPMMVDANAAYTIDDARRLQQLDPLNLMMIEQPLSHEDLIDHSELAHRMRTPICLDESIVNVLAARQALGHGACQIINIKPARVGGLVEAKAIHDVAHKAGHEVWCGGLLETGIGRATNAALATLPAFTLPGDISETARYWDPSEELFEPIFTLNSDGTLTVPTGPGFGVAPVMERVDRATIAKVSVLPKAGG